MNFFLNYKNYNKNYKLYYLISFNREKQVIIGIIK